MSANAHLRTLPPEFRPEGPLQRHNSAISERPWVQITLIAVALLFLLGFLLLPLVAVFAEALRHGWKVYLAAIVEPDARSAIALTLLTAAIVVPLNLVFGLAAAWAVTKVEFRRSTEHTSELQSLMRSSYA